MKRINIFGIQSLLVNGTAVQTYQVMVKNTDANRLILEASGLFYSITQTNKLRCCYSTTDMLIFHTKVQKLGIALKAIASHKLNNRYSWVVTPSI